MNRRRPDFFSIVISKDALLSETISPPPSTSSPLKSYYSNWQPSHPPLYPLFALLGVLPHLSILYSLFPILYPLFPVLYSLFSILYSLSSILYPLSSILYSLFSILYSLFSILYSLFSILYSLFPILYIKNFPIVSILSFSS